MTLVNIKLPGRKSFYLPKHISTLVCSFAVLP
jgi:hypothetical protein